MASEALPFDGLKVIDCASFIAAPAAATILGDLGADVIKIEPPEGDPYREFYRSPGMPPTERNFPWEIDARGKRGVALDLRQPQGLAVLHRLVRDADVFVTNLPLPARERLKVDHAALAPLNPRLIYGSFTAYGETGPEAGKTGFDSTAYWARSGLMDLVKADHDATPARSVSGMGDHPSGVALYAAIVTALLRRERTGRGGLVTSSLLANGVWANGVMAQAALDGLTMPPRLPREQAPNPLTNLYRCRDGRWLNLTLLNPARQFQPLCEAMECPELLSDPRFATVEGRSANHLALLAVLDARFLQRDLADWRARFDAAGITFGIVGSIYDMAGDEQMRAAGVVLPFADGSGLTVNSPFEIDGVRKRAPGPAPRLGQHGDEVLAQAGYSADEIAALRAAGVLL
jgi:crotonobetainyl-CoA:carnitine CoA-transferase CaiB-like acyl-CoA transferase